MMEVVRPCVIQNWTIDPSSETPAIIKNFQTRLNFEKMWPKNSRKWIPTEMAEDATAAQKMK